MINLKDKPFTPHLLRMYFVIDMLDEVAQKANKLADFADYEPLEFTEANTPLVALYPRRYRGGQLLLSRQSPAGNKTDPLCKVYARPVRGSLPLFVIKDNPSGQYFITTDPYAECEREPFENPFKPGDPAYEKYQNRIVYRAYKQKTDWIELLGFVMPKSEADASLESITLSSVSEVEKVFRAGEKADAGEIMARK